MSTSFPPESFEFIYVIVAPVLLDIRSNIKLRQRNEIVYHLVIVSYNGIPARPAKLNII